MGAAGLPPKAAEFAFNNAVRVLDGQNLRVDSMDTKAGILLAADGVLAGFLVGADSVLLRAPKCFATVAVILLVLASIFALGAFYPRKYHAAPVAQAVADDSDNHDDDLALKWSWVGNVLEAVAFNNKALEHKGVLLRFAGAGLAMTLLVLGIGLIWGINTN